MQFNGANGQEFNDSGANVQANPGGRAARPSQERSDGDPNVMSPLDGSHKSGGASPPGTQQSQRKSEKAKLDESRKQAELLEQMKREIAQKEANLAAIKVKPASTCCSTDFHLCYEQGHA